MDRLQDALGSEGVASMEADEAADDDNIYETQ